jgi:hypothetical protein
MPLIVIDRSDLTPDRRWQLLRASVAVEERGMTLNKQVHPQSRATSSHAHSAFLTMLAAMLPPDCIPILITDADFRDAWFRLVKRLGWYWISRIRNRDMASPANGGEWAGCKTLYPLATSQATSLGQFNYVRNHPMQCRLVLVKHADQKRHKIEPPGEAGTVEPELEECPCATLALAIGSQTGVKQLELKFQSNT